MKKIFCMAFAAGVLLSAAVCAAAEEISVTLDGKAVAFDAEPRMINDCVMVPMRQMFVAIDAEILWDSETAAATAVKDALYAKFTDGIGFLELGACKNGKNDGERVYYDSVRLESAPTVIDETMYIPARAFAEAFHYNIEWNAEKSCVEVTTPTDADGWIYYSSWTDGGHLYKMDTNRQHRQMLSDDDCYSERGSFEYRNGCLYYSIREPEHPEQEGSLYRIKTDGTGKEKLTEKPVRMISSRESGEDPNELFFITGEKDEDGYFDPDTTYLCKLNTENGEITQLLDDPIQDNSLVFYKDWIYFMYVSDKLDKAFSIFRMDRNGENILNVSGNFAVLNYNFNIENDKIMFYPFGSRDRYRADPDGANCEKVSLGEENRVQGAETYGLNYVIYADDHYMIGPKDWDMDQYYVLDSNGRELSVITPPDGYSINIKGSKDKIYYCIYRLPKHMQTFYVSGLDELLGMQDISVGEELVDGKYEITGYRDWDSFDHNPTDAEIHSVNFDGTEDTVLLKGYMLWGFDEDQRLVLRRIPDTGKFYYYDPDTGIIEEGNQYESEHYYVNENMMYSIVVNNDGTID